MHYGIGSELNHWLAKGLTVVMNGSRAYLSEASGNYPELLPILIEVSPEILRTRLSSRGRESAADIESRLQRAHEYTRLSHAKLLRFSNNAALSETGPAFVELIRSHTKVIA
jgi:ribose 1,5-bisphosphokinase